MEEQQAIQTIFVKPRNQDYAIYVINDNKEMHTMKYDDLFVFIMRFLSPSKSIKLRDMFSRFRSFIVSIDEQEVYELEFDFDSERERLRRETLQLSTIKTSRELSLSRKKDMEHTVFDRAKKLISSILSKQISP